MAEDDQTPAAREQQTVDRLRTLETTDTAVRRRQMRSLLRVVAGAGEQR